MTQTIISVGNHPETPELLAEYLDGTTAAVHSCTVILDERKGEKILNIVVNGEYVARWPVNDVRILPDQADRTSLVLGQKGQLPQRMIVRQPELLRLVKQHCRHLKKRNTARGRGRIFIWAVGAVASVAFIIAILVPLMADQLAEFLPPEGEKALGDATFHQIRAALGGAELEPLGVCDNDEGLMALAQMQAVLEQHTNLPYTLTVHVLDHDLINAFALPGGRIVIFRGLIDAAEGPDEVAAVFAHEIGHVANRDPTRGALRSAGSIGVLGLLFGDFAGGAAVLFLTNQLIEANYSQQAETDADTFAHKTLGLAGIPPTSLGTMFQRLRDEYGEEKGLVAHFLSHPSLVERIVAANVADNDTFAVSEPSLSDTQWEALQIICD